jgi:creatinine amidohydrolase/Fe(II)-dependent formamide hydrolase-like protein
MARKTSRVLGELTSPEIGRRLKPTSILLLPVGAIEQHGGHLPLNTDAVIAEELTRRMVARWGDAFDLWQLPTVTASLSREHDWAPGTLCLSLENFIALMRDLAREIARALPARNLVIVNGHGGNRGVLENLMRDLAGDHGLNGCVIHPFDLTRVKATSAAVDVHGGESETAVMLALAPQLVRRDAIPRPGTAADAAAIAALVFERGTTFPWRSDDARLAVQGVIGAAHLASPQLGRKIVDSIVAEARSVFERLLENRRLVQGPDAAKRPGAARTKPAAAQPHRRASRARTSRRSGNPMPRRPRRKS